MVDRPMSFYKSRLPAILWKRECHFLTVNSKNEMNMLLLLLLLLLLH